MISKRIPEIDALRGWAALFVLACHVLAGATNFQFINDIFGMSGWAVQIFFCASGFLLYGSFTRRSRNEKNPALNFYIRRFFRIIPLWWLLLLFEFSQGVFSGRVLLANMFFYFGFLSYDKVFLPIVPAWSLFTEECFYFIFPAVYGVLKKWNSVLFLLFTYILGLLWQRYAVEAGVPATNDFLQRVPPVNFQFFFIGIFIYQIYVSNRMEGYLANIFGKHSAFWLDAFCILGFLSLPLGFWVPHELSVLFFVLAVLSPGTYVHRLINISFFRWAGVRCYGIYIIHSVLITWLEKMNYDVFGLANRSAEYRVLVLFPIYSGAALLLAAVSYIIIEKPCLKFAERVIQLKIFFQDSEFRPDQIPS